MAEKKVVGRLVNTVSFQTDRASLQKALADVKKVKDAMRGVSDFSNKMRSQTSAIKQQTAAIKQQQVAINQKNKAQQDGDKSALKMNRLHGRALAENAKRDRLIAQNAARVSARKMDMTRSDRFGLTSRLGSTAGRKFNNIADQFRNGSISARMYRQQVSALRRDLSGAAAAQRGFNGTLKDMRSAFVQLTASYTAFAGLMGIADIGKQFQGFQSALTMGFGGDQNAAPMIEYLRKEIRRLGLDIKDTTDDFSKLAVAAKGKLNNEDLKSLFSGYMEFANVAGAGKERTSLGIRAIQQMLSKGVILAEEFRSQMAEQVVGSDKAFRMAVEEMIGRALKKGELEDMMQKRMLDPEVLLPLVGKYFHQLANDGGALEKKLKQLAAVESRMKESWIQFVNVLYDKGVEDALTKLYKGLDRVFNSIKQLAGTAIGRFLKGALDMISETVLTLLDTIQIIIYLIDQAFGSNTEAKGFAAEILGMVVAAVALAKIFIGIKRTLVSMLGLSRLIAATNTAGAILDGKSTTGGSSPDAKKGMGIVSKVFIVGAAAAVGFAIGTAIREALGMDKEIGKLGSNLWENTHQSDFNKLDFGKFDVDKTLSRFGIQNLVLPSFMLKGVQNLMTNEPQKVDVNITMNQNAKDFIEAQIQDNNQRQYNMLMPSTSKPYSYITTP